MLDASTLILLALMILAGCDKRKAKPVATTPVPARVPATPRPVASWKVVSVLDGDTLPVAPWDWRVTENNRK